MRALLPWPAGSLAGRIEAHLPRRNAGRCQHQTVPQPLCGSHTLYTLYIWWLHLAGLLRFDVQDDGLSASLAAGDSYMVESATLYVHTGPARIKWCCFSCRPTAPVTHAQRHARCLRCHHSRVLLAPGCLYPHMLAPSALKAVGGAGAHGMARDEQAVLERGERAGRRVRPPARNGLSCSRVPATPTCAWPRHADTVHSCNRLPAERAYSHDCPGPRCPPCAVVGVVLLCVGC